MESGWLENCYSGWIPEENPELYRKEDPIKQFSIGVWQGIKNEGISSQPRDCSVLQELSSNISPQREHGQHNIPRGVKTRHRTNSDTNPVCDVTNSASMNFLVSRLSLDNVQSSVSAELEEICSSDSPVNSSNNSSFNSESRLFTRKILGGADNLLNSRVHSNSMIPKIVNRANPRDQVLANRDQNISMEESTSLLGFPADPRAAAHASLSPGSEVVCPHCNFQNSHGLCCPWWRFANKGLQKNQNTDPSRLLSNPVWTPANVTSVDRFRRPIIKTRQSFESDTSYLPGFGYPKPLGSIETASSSSSIAEAQKLPHYLQSSQSHRIANRNDDVMKVNCNPPFPKSSAARLELSGQRNSKRKCPPNYFTSTDKKYFEFFRDYKLPVALTFSQQMLAEAAVGMRPQQSQTDENPFKHLPIHCLKGVLEGQINALDLGLYWQWLTDVVPNAAIQSMLHNFVVVYPDLFTNWKSGASDESHPTARLIDHITHILLLLCGDVTETSSAPRHTTYVNAFNRAVKASRNPAPLNRTQVVVALTPLLGQDPLLLEKVLCAIPRYKMSFSQLFGSYGTGNGEFTEPSGLAVLKDGRLAVVDTNQHRIMIFKDDRQLDICFSSDEDAMQADKLSRLEMEQHSHQHSARSSMTRNRRWNGYLMYPNRAAIDPITGHLVLTERAPHPQIQVFTETGRFVRRFGEGYLENPRGLCVDSESRIIVVECKIMRVTIWSNYQYESDFIASDLGFPNSVAADARRRLYITDNEAHCVRIFSYAGQPLGSIGGPGLTNFPVAVRLRPSDGAICVFDNHNNFNMTVFTSEGALLEARESEIKHAQIHDVQLRPSDGAVIQAGKDYRVYVYKPYPYYLRGRDQRSPLTMCSSTM